MSSNPLVMGYEGGDLLLTGVAGQRSGRRPGMCVQAVDGGLVGRRLWFSDVRLSALEAEDRRTTGLTAGLTAYATMRYINRRSLPFQCGRAIIMHDLLHRLRILPIQLVIGRLCPKSIRHVSRSFTVDGEVANLLRTCL